jgi:hypothetical protein
MNHTIALRAGRIHLLMNRQKSQMIACPPLPFTAELPAGFSTRATPTFSSLKSCWNLNTCRKSLNRMDAPGRLWRAHQLKQRLKADPLRRKPSSTYAIESILLLISPVDHQRGFLKRLGNRNAPVPETEPGDCMTLSV